MGQLREDDEIIKEEWNTYSRRKAQKKENERNEWNCIRR
jgi:hypothetical protein